MSQFRIGTSGWNYAHWRNVFDPPALAPRDWFRHYSQVFDTVEINNTFYQLPKEETFDHWREQALAGFVYAVKANRYLTHQKKLKDATEPLGNFLARVRRLRGRLGPILYQLPPRWKRNVERLDGFCRLLPKGLTHVFEFREREWLTEETYAVLEEHGACLCIHDMLAHHPRRVTGPAVYVRFHGAGERYAGSYRRDRLRRWADWMHETAGNTKPVYAFFNNDAQGYAVRNALTLRELLAASR